MTISTNDAVYKHGSNTEVINTAGAVSDGNFSGAGDNTTFTNSDDAPIAQFVLDGTLSGAPSAGTTVDLFVQLLNASGASPSNQPSSNHEAIYLGSFLMDASGAGQVAVLGPVGLPSLQDGQQYDFYIKNNTGVSLNAGATVDIVPLTYGPKA